MNSNLYNEGIKELAQSGESREPLKNPDCEVTIDNPLCGDRVTMQVKLNNGCVVEEAHQVKGCLLCRASANAIASAVVGASQQDMLQVEQNLRAMLKNESDGNALIPGWEVLDLFRPVVSHKSRHDCVLLPFKALLQMIQQNN